MLKKLRIIQKFLFNDLSFVVFSMPKVHLLFNQNQIGVVCALSVHLLCTHCAYNAHKMHTQCTASTHIAFR